MSCNSSKSNAIAKTHSQTFTLRILLYVHAAMPQQLEEPQGATTTALATMQKARRNGSVPASAPSPQLETNSGKWEQNNTGTPRHQILRQAINPSFDSADCVCTLIQKILREHEKDKLWPSTLRLTTHAE